MFELPKKLKRDDERFDLYERTHYSNIREKQNSRASSIVDGQNLNTSTHTRENLKTTDLRDNTPHSRTPRTNNERFDTDQKDYSNILQNTSEIYHNNDKSSNISTSFTQLRNKTIQGMRKHDKYDQNIDSRVFEANKMANLFQKTSNTGFFTQLNNTFDPDSPQHEYKGKKSININ